jgi:hypothetical protein
MEKLPKDEAGWPKTMSPEEEASFLETLSEEERHCMVGLGGSQKAEVAWMEANGIAFERLDVEVFFANNPSGATRANAGIGQKVAATSTKYVIESFGQKVAATSTKYVIESFSSSSDHCMTNPMVRSSTTCNVNPGKANRIQRFCFSNPIHHASTDAPIHHASTGASTSTVADRHRTEAWAGEVEEWVSDEEQDAFDLQSMIEPTAVTGQGGWTATALQTIESVADF